MADPRLDILNSATGNTPVAAGGTITFQYPDARARSSYLGDGAGVAVLGVRASQALYNQDTDFTLALNSDSIVITYNGVVSIPANTPVSLQLFVRDSSGAPVTYINPYGVPPEVFPFGI